MRSVLKRFDPLLWPEKTIKITTVAFFAIALPIYLFIGLQPATAADSTTYDQLSIPGINLNTAVQPLTLSKTNELVAPSTIAGSFSRADNKTLIIGHSTTALQNLKQIGLKDQIYYADDAYSIIKIERIIKGDIDMGEILASADQPTIVIMTCYGEPLGNQDYSHRLIVTAVKR